MKKADNEDSEDSDTDFMDSEEWNKVLEVNLRLSMDLEEEWMESASMEYDLLLEGTDMELVIMANTFLEALRAHYSRHLSFLYPDKRILPENKGYKEISWISCYHDKYILYLWEKA